MRERYVEEPCGLHLVEHSRLAPRRPCSFCAAFTVEEHLRHTTLLANPKPRKKPRPPPPPKPARLSNRIKRDNGAHFNARLTEAQVVEARERCAAGERRADVARDLGVSAPTIGLIVARKTWRHVA